MFDFRKLQRLVIPEGLVKKITHNGVVLWGRFVSLKCTVTAGSVKAIIMLKSAATKAMRAAGHAAQKSRAWLYSALPPDQYGKIGLHLTARTWLHAALSRTLSGEAWSRLILRTWICSVMSPVRAGEARTRLTPRSWLNARRDILQSVTWTALRNRLTLIGRKSSELRKSLTHRFAVKVKTLVGNGAIYRLTLKHRTGSKATAFRGDAAINRLKSGASLRFMVSLPSRFIKQCKTVAVAWFRNLSVLHASGSASRVSWAERFRTPSKVYSGTVALHHLINRMNLNELVRVYAGKQRVVRWILLLNAKLRPRLYPGDGKRAMAKTPGALYTAVIGLGKIPDVALTRETLAKQQKHIVSAKAVQGTGKRAGSIQPSQRFAGWMQDVKNAMLCAAKLGVRLVLRAPDFAAGSIRRTTLDIGRGKICGLLFTDKGNSSISYSKCGIKCAAVMDLTTIWESPEQTGNVLYIKQVYTASQADGTLTIR